MMKKTLIGIIIFALGVLTSQWLFDRFQFNNSEIIKIAKLHFADNSIYTGGVRNGFMHGKGELVWSNGQIYSGEFQSGLFEGLGKMLWPNGDSHEGNYQNGMANGEGVYKANSGLVYEGSFKNGDFSGKGKLVSVDQQEYKGEFAAGAFEGKGMLKYANGDVYNGDFKKGLMEGYGIFNSAAGDKYLGTFIANSLTGEGIHFSAYGGKYQGNFDNWMYSGNGEITYKNNFSYKGEFKAGNYHGSGMLENSNGSYQGDFEQGQYHGKGVFIDNQENEYKGEFKYGAFDGDGNYIYKDGRSFRGTWRNGSLIVGDEDFIKNQVSEVKDRILNTHAITLHEKLFNLKEQEDGKVDHYYLLVGGDGTQNVFKKEVEYIQQYLPEQNTVTLLNEKKYSGLYPIATKETINKVLKYLSENINLSEDIIFIYMTSHGSKNGSFHIENKHIELPSLFHQEMAVSIDKYNIKNKVVIISSCYAGLAIPELKGDRSIIITASSEDRTSFGCSDTSEMTWFGKAFFEGLEGSNLNLVKNFEQAKQKIKSWEKEKGYKHSQPQIYVGSKANIILPIVKNNITQ